MSRASLTAAYLMTDNIMRDFMEIIDAPVRLDRKLATLKGQIRADTERMFREVQHITDSLSIDGTEQLVDYATPRAASREVQNFVFATTMNAGCTLLGFVPIVGNAVAVGCGATSLGDAVATFVADDEENEFQARSRTPTVLDLKGFYQALSDDVRQRLLGCIDELERMSWADVTLASAMTDGGLDRLPLSQSEREIQLKNIWEVSLPIMAHLRAVDSVTLPAPLRDVLQLCQLRQAGEVALGSITFEADVDSQAKIASTLFLELADGVARVGDNGTSGQEVAESPKSLFDRRPNTGKHAIPYQTATMRNIDWQLHVGRPDESRPMTAGFSDLLKQMTIKEIYGLLRGNRYIDAEHTMTPTTMLSRGIAPCKQKCAAVRIRSQEDSGWIRLPDHVTDWNERTANGLYAGEPINQPARSPFWAVGAEVGSAACF